MWNLYWRKAYSLAKLQEKLIVMNFMQIYNYSFYRRARAALSDGNEKPAEKEEANHTQTRYCI